MASITKTAKGYRAQIKLRGVRDSKVLPTARAARDWAAEREAEIILQGAPVAEQNHTLRDMLRRYSEEESVKKKGQRWEQVRLRAFENYLLPLDKKVSEVDATDIALFRDSRLKSISPSSVKREIAVLSSAFQVAKLEWKWVMHNPCYDVKKPPKGQHRERLVQWWEVKKILRESGYVTGKEITSTNQSVGLCFLFALRTGMRSGEICGLTWDRVFERYCVLLDTKNGTRRDVPLSSKALRVLDLMKGYDRVSVFNLSDKTRDVVFRRLVQRAGIEGLTFHDSRHTAATMISKKVDVLELCKIFGWKQTTQALTYFNPTADSLAAKLG